MGEYFENDVFVFLGNPTNKDEHDSLLDKLENELGATIARTINKKTTIVICDDNTLSADITKATSLNIPVVKNEYLLESIKQSKKLDPNNYLLSAASSTGGGSLKRKDMDGDDDNTNTSSVKQQKVVLDSVIQADSTWCGSCLCDGESYPFFWKLQTRDATTNEITGESEWLTLNAKAKFRGKIIINSDNDVQVEWTEYEVIAEADSLDLPQTYLAKLTQPQNKPAILEGKTTTDPSNPSTFKITLTKKSVSSNNLLANSNGSTTSTSTTTTSSVSIPPPPTAPATTLELPWLSTGKIIQGKLSQSYSLTLKVTGRKSDRSVEGNIEWSDFNTKTKFKGAIENDNVKLSEFEVVSGDGVELPVEYNGKFGQSQSNGNGNGHASGVDDSEINGDYKSESGIGGTFTLLKI